MKKCTISLLLVVAVLLSALALPGLAKDVNLVYLETMSSPERSIMIEEMIKEYEAQHPGVKIQLVSPPYEQASQKATLMLNTNQKVDIIEVRDYDIKQYVNNGRLTDLTDYYSKWKDAKTLTGVALQSARTVNDIPYIVPQCIYIKALYVRKDVLEACGIDYIPSTISELAYVCRAITDPSKNQYGFGWRGKSAEFKFELFFTAPYITELENARDIFSEGATHFGDPRYRLAMRQYVDLFKHSVPKDAINWGFTEQINGFVSGSTPFLIQDPDCIPVFNKMLGKEKYVVVPLPVGPLGYSCLDYGFTGLGIPSYSKNKAEAWDFVKWMSSPERNAAFDKSYGPLPVHSVTYENDPYFSEGHYAAYGYELTHPEEYKFLVYPLHSAKWPGWSQIHESDMQSLLLGKTDMETVLAKWEKYWSK